MAKSRGQGEGNIRQRKDGSWEARYTLGVDSNGKQIRRSIYGKTRSEVSKRLTKTLNEINMNTYIDPAKVTVREWIDLWLEEYKKDSVSAKTYESYKENLDRYITPWLGDIYLKDLRPEMVQSTFNKMKYLSKRTIEYTRTIFNMCMKRARINKLITENPCEYLELPKGKPKKEVVIFTEEEQQIFMKAIDGHQYQVAFLVLISVGLRVGEMLALTWDDVDFEENTVDINKTLSRTKGELFNPPKTELSKRLLPVLDPIMEILKSHKVQQNIIKLQAGKDYNPYNLVFTNMYGYPVDFKAFARSLKRVCKDNCLPEVSPHKLRHTFATRGLESGMDMKELQILLGHSTMKLTSDTYTHVLDKQKKKAIDKTAHLYTGIN